MELVSEIEVRCPYCGETFVEVVDTMERQCDTIVDCAICCRPIHLHLACTPGEAHLLDAERD